MDRYSKDDKVTVEEIIKAYKKGDKNFKSDILGSYTGDPQQDSKPEQDADDL